MNDQFVHDISNILEQARQRAKTAVNLSMVYAYYEIGECIVMEEQQGEQRDVYGQQGEQRDVYGQQVLSELSRYITEQFGKGFSVANLKNIRRFTSCIPMIRLARQCLANLRTCLLWTPEGNSMFTTTTAR